VSIISELYAAPWKFGPSQSEKKLWCHLQRVKRHRHVEFRNESRMKGFLNEHSTPFVACCRSHFNTGNNVNVGGWVRQNTIVVGLYFIG